MANEVDRTKRAFDLRGKRVIAAKTLNIGIIPDGSIGFLMSTSQTDDPTQGPAMAYTITREEARELAEMLIKLVGEKFDRDKFDEEADALLAVREARGVQPPPNPEKWES